MSDDIIKMAKEAGLVREWMDLCKKDEGALARFATLIRADERDRCCRIIYGMAGSDNVAQRTVDAIRNNT